MKRSIIFTVLAAFIVAVSCAPKSRCEEAERNVEYWKSKHQLLVSQYDELYNDYENLKGRYDDLSNTYDELNDNYENIYYQYIYYLNLANENANLANEKANIISRAESVVRSLELRCYDDNDMYWELRRVKNILNGWW